MATLAGYVAYMDEDKLGIAWQEDMYSDRDSGVYLRSINVDMKNGVILDNESVSYKKRSAGIRRRLRPLPCLNYFHVSRKSGANEVGI